MPAGARPPAPAGRAEVAALSGSPTNITDLGQALELSAATEARQALLRAWQDWSDGLFERADGPWAVAVADAAGLHLYRDPSGLASMYWARQADGNAAAAPDLATACALHGGPPRLAGPALHEYLRLLDVAAPATFCEAVRAVEPGCALRIDATRVTGGPRPPRSDSPTPGDFGTAVDELGGRLSTAVTTALAGAERPAAFLSGGVDSALVCALAARQGAGPVALTVGFDGQAFDEAPAAARVAAHLGLRHEVLRFGRRDCVAALDRLARGMDQPMADPTTMVTLLAFEHCHEHFDGVLDGTGADEAVGAMPPRHVRLAVEYGSRVPAGLRRVLVRAMARVPGLAGYTPILDFEHPAEALMRWQGFTRAEIEELCGEPVSLEDTTFYRTFARYPRHAHYERYSALLNAMPCDRLTQAMKLTGLRVRFPFCARDVDGFLRQLPTEWRHLPGQPKRILRELLARYVPRELWDGPKRGFTFPLHDFLAGDGYALLRQHVLAGRWLGRGLLRPGVVRRYAQAYIGGDRRLMFRVWALVVLGAWLDAHEDLTIPAPGD
jgi:asparagine synthase (glutamine-hydrolysing)